MCEREVKGIGVRKEYWREEGRALERRDGLGETENVGEKECYWKGKNVCEKEWFWREVEKLKTLERATFQQT